jgi:hypothetical protein
VGPASQAAGSELARDEGGAANWCRVPQPVRRDRHTRDKCGRRRSACRARAGRAVRLRRCWSRQTGSQFTAAFPETAPAVVRRHCRRSVRCAFLATVSSRLRRRVGRACSDSSAHPRRSRAPRADCGVCLSDPHVFSKPAPGLRRSRILPNLFGRGPFRPWVRGQVWPSRTARASRRTGRAGS